MATPSIADRFRDVIDELGELVVRVRNLVHADAAHAATARSLAREQAAREAVETQKRVLHSLFMQAPVLIVVVRGPDHIVELANPQMCRAAGQPESAILNRRLFDVSPELRDQPFPALLDKVFATGVPHVGREAPANLDRGDGVVETRYFDFVYSPSRDGAGNIDGVFIIASDVTQQVHARAQITSLRDVAESANRAKDEFLAMLGHELRNPLSPIVTALQVMKLRGSPGCERERTIIERQVNHLTRLVDDLMDVSRIARGRVELKLQTVEMADVVATALEMARPLLERRRHTLTVDVARRGLAVNGDPTRLSQVIANLLTNAAKYTPPGGAISVRGAREKEEIVLSVRDNGIGISAEELPRIFDLFVQERQALDRAHGGLGIGLSIARSLLQRHGGSIAAASDGLGNGSELTVRLPAAAGTAVTTEPAEAPRAARERAKPTAHAERVLVVDDNEDGAELLAEALTNRGYETRVAGDGPTALRVAEELSPDIAFLDIGLPVMDGYELAAHLRALPGLECLRLIALTGYGQESDRRKTLAAGFDRHLVKPVDIETIEASMRSN